MGGSLVDLDMRELGIDLLVKGLRSSPIAKGYKFAYLMYTEVASVQSYKLMITDTHDNQIFVTN